MYCSHCGAQIPDDSAFCPKCGQKPGQAGQPAAQTAAASTAPPVQPVYAVPVQTTYVQPMKSRSEVIREYRETHGYYGYCTGAILFGLADITCFIVLLVKFIDLANHPIRTYLTETQESILFWLFFCLFLSVVFSICSNIMIKKAKNVNEEAENEYKNYCYQMENGGRARNTSSIFSDSNRRSVNGSGNHVPPPANVSPGSWKCPFCGRINASYVGTCACGNRKP